MVVFLDGRQWVYGGANSLETGDDDEELLLLQTLTFPGTHVCSVDLDGDGIVGVTDLLALLQAWGPCGGYCPGDFDRDGVVGVRDLLWLVAEVWSAD